MPSRSRHFDKDNQFEMAHSVIEPASRQSQANDPLLAEPFLNPLL